METKIIDGQAIAERIYQELAVGLAELKKRSINPKLTAVLVGDNPASKVYVSMKGKRAAALGMASETLHLPKETSEQELCDLIDRLNGDASVHGILVQMPLPRQINEDRIIERIAPEKDVDGFHPVNKGRLQTGQAELLPCTPAGVIEMLLRSGNSPAGKHVVVIGRSQIVGMPLAIMLAQKADGANATVTLCHSYTKNISAFTRNADILIAAIGRPHFVTADMVRQGAVVIDVGVNRVEDATSEKGYRLVGDVDYDAVFEKVSAISPVPGGVGPLTIAMLLKNTLLAARRQLRAQ